MSRIALITDTHEGVRNDAPVFYDYFKKSFDWMFSIIDEQKIETVIHLGDLYDRRKYLNYVTAKRTREDFLAPLNERGIQTHILVGNHDSYYKDTHEVNSLKEIVDDRYENIHTYSIPALIEIDGCSLQLLPWITPSNYQISMDTIKTSQAEILLGHLDLMGFEELKGRISDHGMDSQVFDRFDMVLSGHFHHRSTIRNIHYLGAFTEQTWSDYNDPRGFTIFDTDTRQLEFHKNPFTLFKMISYDDVKDLNIYETIRDTDYSSFANSYVKIVCVAKNNPVAFDTLCDKLYKVGPTNVSVVEDVSTFVDNEEDTEIDQSEDTPTLLRKFIDGLTLAVDPAKIKTLMQDIYMEALTLDQTT